MENKLFFKYKCKCCEYVEGSSIRTVNLGVVLADDSVKAFERVQEWFFSPTVDIEQISIYPIPAYDGNWDIDKDSAIVSLKEKIIEDK